MTFCSDFIYFEFQLKWKYLNLYESRWCGWLILVLIFSGGMSGSHFALVSVARLKNDFGWLFKNSQNLIKNSSAQHSEIKFNCTSLASQNSFLNRNVNCQPIQGQITQNTLNKIWIILMALLINFTATKVCVRTETQEKREKMKLKKSNKNLTFLVRIF